MKRNILTLLMVALAAISFGQVPKHLRVLNYVPDSCYSLSIVNLDTMARVFELEAMHRENFLKPLYDSVKFSKKLVQSWLKRDSKLGVDFTASAAYVDSRYVLLPLNNEKNFEKMLCSLDKSLPPFVTMTDPAGRKFRCMVVEDSEYGAAVMCTEDVACLALLVDLNSLNTDAMLESFSPESLDTLDPEILNNVLNNPKMESPMQVWNRLSQSRFATSELASTMLSGGWDSYTAYHHGNPLVSSFASALSMVVQPTSEIRNALQQLDLEFFSRGDVFRDRITLYCEIQQHKAQQEELKLKTSQKKLKKLMPYVSGDYMVMAVSSFEGLGDLAMPYLDNVPQLQPYLSSDYSQWRELSPLMNNPFVFTASVTDKMNMQIITLVDRPGEVRGVLERYVNAYNHYIDSVQKPDPVVEEHVYEEEEQETVVEESADGEIITVLEDPNLEPEDSTLNRKTLTYRKLRGVDTYVITTKRREMDYETFTWVTKDDSDCVLVKDDLLFYTNSLATVESILEPYDREWPEEYFAHLFYARMDFDALIPVLGPEAAMPVRDMVGYVDENAFTMNVNAVPGLRHGVLYEMVKYVMDLLKNI